VDAGIVVTGLVRADDEILHVHDFRIHIKRAADADRTGESDISAGGFPDHGGVRQNHFIGLQQLSQLDLIHIAVAAHHDGCGLAVDAVDQRLDEMLGVFLQKIGDFLDGAGMRRFHQRQFFGRFFRLAGIRYAGGDFNVAGEIALVAQNQSIFAHLRDCLEFFRKQAAHDAGVGADDGVVQMQAVHDVLVGLELLLVGGIASLFIDVKGIGILHLKFTGTDQAEAGPRLIAELLLHLVQRERHVLVGTDLHLCSQSEQFLMRRAEHERLAVAVLQGEHAAAESGPPAAGHIDLFRDQAGHQKLLASRLVHFIPDDGFDPADGLQSQRHQHIDAGGAFFDITGPDQHIAGTGILIFHILAKGIKIAVFQSHCICPLYRLIIP